MHNVATGYTFSFSKTHEGQLVTYNASTAK